MMSHTRTADMWAFTILVTLFVISFPNTLPADDMLPTDSSGTELINQRADRHFRALEDTLVQEERHLLEQLGATPASRPDTNVVAQVQDDYRAQPSYPDYSIPAEDPDYEKVIAELESQQTELDTLLGEFQAIEEKSRGIEDKITSFENLLVDARTSGHLASQKLKDLKDQLAPEEATTNEQSSGATTPEKTPAQPAPKTEQVPDFRQWQANIALPKRATRRVEQVIQFGGKKITSDMPLAQLVKEAVPFRAGPANQFDSLFRGKQGEVVAIEKRYENWYRIIHQTGVRGWVSDKDILFGPTSRDLPGKLIRIKAYNIEIDKSDWEAPTETS